MMLLFVIGGLTVVVTALFVTWIFVHAHGYEQGHKDGRKFQVARDAAARERGDL